jgi:hypothetical protein
MEGADQILAVAGVDPGLAANRAVDLGQQRGRDLNVVDATQGDRGGQPGKIADHPAADGQDSRRPLGAQIEQLVQQLAQLRQVFGSLARGHRDPAPRDRCRVQTLLQGRQMRRCGEVGVGHDDRRSRHHLGQLRSGTRQQTVSDHDVVAAGAEPDPKPFVAVHGTASAT